MKHNSLQSRSKSLAVLGLSLLAAGAAQAWPSSFGVYVGYADGLRGAGFFPSPWGGDSSVDYVGTPVASGNFDAGAIRVDNSSGATMTVDVKVSFPWAGINNYDIWGTQTVPNGDRLVLTQTGYYNFDSSDFGPTQPNGVPLPDGETAHAPVVDVYVNGSAVPVSFLDTGHVLTTGGYDYAYNGGNESFNWRPIGTSGITNPNGSAPDVTGLGTVLMAGLGLVGFGRSLRRSA